MPPEIDIAALVAQLEEACRRLEPPFLALPERGETAEALAYRRGARDAYQAVLDVLKCKPPPAFLRDVTKPG